MRAASLKKNKSQLQSEMLMHLSGEDTEGKLKAKIRDEEGNARSLLKGIGMGA